MTPHSGTLRKVDANGNEFRVEIITGVAGVECSTDMTVLKLQAMLWASQHARLDTPADDWEETASNRKDLVAIVVHEGCLPGRTTWYTTAEGRWLRYETGETGSTDRKSGAITTVCMKLAPVEG